MPLIPIEDDIIKQQPIKGKLELAPQEKQNIFQRVGDSSIVRNLVDFVDQIGVGAIESLDDLSKLLGVEQVTTPGKGAFDEQGNLREPETFLGGIGRTIGEFAAPLPGGPAMEAAVGGVLEGVTKAPKVLASAARVKNFLKPIAELSGKGISFIGEILSSIPREFMERALKKEAAGKSILKGKFFADETFENIGKKAQNAINYIEKQAGKAVFEEQAALTGKNVLIKTDDIVGLVDDFIDSKTVEGVSSLTNADLKELREIQKLLIPDKKLKGIKFPVSKKPGEIINISKQLAQVAESEPIVMSVAKANVIKRKLQNMVKFDPQTVKKTSSEADGAIKRVANEINQRIRTAVPEYAQVNDKFANIKNIKNRLQTKMKDENIARNLKNLATKDQTTRSLFYELDSIAPDSLKFMDELEDAIVRNAFEEIFPGRGGGSGSAQGIGNLLRAGAGVTNPKLLPLFSPKIQAKTIRSVGLAKEILTSPQLVPRIAQKGTVEIFGRK